MEPSGYPTACMRGDLGEPLGYQHSCLLLTTLFFYRFPSISETCQPGRSKWRVPRNHIPHLTHKWPLGLWCPGTLCWNCLCPSIGFPWHMLRMKGPHVHSRDYTDRLPFMVTIGWRFKGLKAPMMTLDQAWKWDGLVMIRNAQACMRWAGFRGR